MQNEINLKKSIKEKAEFICLNSGLLLTKLENNLLKKEIENYLIVLLLYDTKYSDEEIIKYNLLLKNEISRYENNYDSAIQIISHITNIIDNNIFFEEGKLRLKNKLMEYTRYFSNDNKISFNNKKYVRIQEKN